MARGLPGGIVAAFALLVFAVPASAAPAVATANPVFFKTPTKVYCYFVPAAKRSPATLRCDVETGLRPRPRGACRYYWPGITMRARGPAVATCAGDLMLNPRARTVAYGATFSRGGFVCVSRRTGLRCTNGSKRGFVLSPRRWRVF